MLYLLHGGSSDAYPYNWRYSWANYYIKGGAIDIMTFIKQKRVYIDLHEVIDQEVRMM